MHLKNMKYNFFGIYPKLLGIFLVIIIPIYTIGLLINKSGVNVVENQLIQMNAQKNEFWLSS